jgi:aspartate ammonia-lyase
MPRIEHDFLGDRELPDNAYYGVQTLRGMENFHITGIPIGHSPSFVRGLALVKKACALANRDAGVLDTAIADAIVQACDVVASGAMNDQFVVDMIQGGAGTSTNMNANEVIANKALEILGHPKGTYSIVSPNDHVNMSQSTNDAYPTAFRITLYEEVEDLMESMVRLEEAFMKKGEEFKDILKMGRTQLQDAVPMTLGDEFESFAVNIGEDIRRLHEARTLVTEVNLGGTAIGTGINAPEGFSELAVKHLREVSGIPVVLAPHLIEATWDNGAYVQLSGVLKRVAVKLSKICNDLRLLSSGPRAGFNEINLPRLQPGSSIMPGKVNPVIPEVVNQVCFLVIGNDVTVSFAAEAGQLQLNVMEPVAAYCLFQSLESLERACDTLRERCIEGITANPSVTRAHVMNSIGIITALNPILGYSVCAEIAREAYETGASVADLVINKGLLTREKLDEVFSDENLKHPKFIQ